MADDLHAISSEDLSHGASADPPAAGKRPLPPGDPAHGAPDRRRSRRGRPAGRPAWAGHARRRSPRTPPQPRRPRRRIRPRSRPSRSSCPSPTSSIPAWSAPRRKTPARREFPQPVAPPAGAPNVLLILVDDAGFGQFGTFGGAVPTPTADALAAEGLQVQPLPHHRPLLADAGRADHRPQPPLGQQRRRRRDRLRLRRLHRHHPAQHAATVAETLQLNGYSTAWFGKNHNVPAWEHGPGGTVRSLADRAWASTTSTASSSGEADQWHPMLWENTTPVTPYLDNPDYILNDDLADKAIAWIDNVTTFAPDKPYFCLLLPRRHPRPAPGAGRVERSVQRPVRRGV